MFSDLGGPQQPLSLSLGVVFFVQGSAMDVIDYDPRNNGDLISGSFSTFSS